MFNSYSVAESLLSFFYKTSSAKWTLQLLIIKVTKVNTMSTISPATNANPTNQYNRPNPAKI
jgi:hypothetical protein